MNIRGFGLSGQNKYVNETKKRVYLAIIIFSDFPSHLDNVKFQRFHLIIFKDYK